MSDHLIVYYNNALYSCPPKAYCVLHKSAHHQSEELLKWEINDKIETEIPPLRSQYCTD